MQRVVLLLTLQVALLAVAYRKYGQSYFGFGCGFEDQEELLIRSRRVVTSDGVIPATIYVKNGKIQELISDSDSERLNELDSLKLIDYGRLVVSPSLIDSHVHFGEPGFDEREGIKKGTRAAAAGGVATVVDMPFPCSPLTDSCQRLKSKIFRFKREAFINIGAWGGITPENCGNEDVLKCMVEETQVMGFHSNLEPVYDSSLEPVNVTHIATAMSILARLGVPYSIQAQTQSRDERWNPESELAAVKEVIEVMKNLELTKLNVKPGFVVHFTHLSSASTFRAIAEAYDEGLFVSADMAPHYLHFTDKAAEDNPLLAVHPPLGSEPNRQDLWEFVESIGGIGELVISSDHTPSTPEGKTRQGDRSHLGVSGIQYTLPVVWNGLSKGGYTESDILRLSKLLSGNPAKLLRLDRYKGAIAKGFDADLTVWNPDKLADTTAKGSKIMHRENSPYLESELRGRVHATWLKGNLIFQEDRGLSWGSCRKIFGLGEWARIVVLYFLPVSFAEE